MTGTAMDDFNGFLRPNYQFVGLVHSPPLSNAHKLMPRGNH